VKISIIADEISQDVHAAVYIGSQMWNVNQYELRFIQGKRVPDIDEQQIEQLASIKEKYDIAYSAIGAGYSNASRPIQRLSGNMRGWRRQSGWRRSLAL
jgi:hypothetical protein